MGDEHGIPRGGPDPTGDGTLTQREFDGRMRMQSLLERADDHRVAMREREQALALANEELVYVRWKHRSVIAVRAIGVAALLLTTIGLGPTRPVVSVAQAGTLIRGALAGLVGDGGGNG